MVSGLPWFRVLGDLEPALGQKPASITAVRQPGAQHREVTSVSALSRIGNDMNNGTEENPPLRPQDLQIKPKWVSQQYHYCDRRGRDSREEAEARGEATSPSI